MSPLLEVALLIAYLLLGLWVLPIERPPVRVPYFLAGLFLLFFLEDRRRRRWNLPWRAYLARLGLRREGFREAIQFLWWPFIAFCLVALAGSALGTPRGLHSLYALVGYPLWALLQEYLLLAFTARRFQEAGLPDLLAAFLFALLHWPNRTLLFASLLGGTLFVVAYRKHENLWVPALFHALAGLLLSSLLPRSWLPSFRVGRFY